MKRSLRWVGSLLVLGFVLVPVHAEISLPEPLAIEIPAAGETTIHANDSPLAGLLESATSTSGPVTHDRSGFVFPLGPTLVTWTDGIDDASAYVYIYPFGQTPVGSTGYERATSGNGGTNVVRDQEGKVHVAWLDSGRSEDQVRYRRGAQDPNTGSIAWETQALRISEPSNDVYNSMVGIAVSDSYVHFAWYGGGDNTYYRRLRLSDYNLDPVHGTGAGGSLSDNGPDIAVRGDDEIHIVTPASGSGGGQYAVSTDGGLDWMVQDIPRPVIGIRMKAPSIGVDQYGNAHVVFPWIVRNSGTHYWELRYIRRTPVGAWEDAHYLLGQFPEWQDPLDDGDPSNDGWDMLSDWLEITVGEDDHLHVAWHGTLNTHAFGVDEAFYIRRTADGVNSWSASWDPYVTLWPASSGLSFAPSILVDASSQLAVPVLFYDTSASYEFDSNFKLMRDGAWDGEPAVSLTTMAADGHGLSTWFPCVAPRLFTHTNGRVWLDVVATDWPADASSDMLIVHQRRDMTPFLRDTPILFVERERLSWTGLSVATGYDVVRGDLQTLRGSQGDFTAATDECLIEDSTLTSIDYTTAPTVGQGFWFLVRGVDGIGGLTYDTLEASQIETRDEEIDQAGNACF